MPHIATQNGNQIRGGMRPEDSTNADGHCPMTYLEPAVSQTTLLFVEDTAYPAVNMDPAYV